jgi:hypothetical protein
MNTSTFRNAKYAALGEMWCRHQTARILSRHLQCGKHCRLDLDALLAGIARMLRPEIPDGMPSEILLEPTIGDSDDDYRVSGRTTTGSKVSFEGAEHPAWQAGRCAARAVAPSRRRRKLLHWNPHDFEFRGQFNHLARRLDYCVAIMGGLT